MKIDKCDVIELAKAVDPNSTIPSFFAGKNIFMTGASGFMGKVLIEKLLRTCPDVGTIYILLREKREQSMNKRIELIFGNVLFDKLRKENPNALKKIVPIEGNCRQLRLGISDADRKTIIENVSIVYHIAATVRFDEPLAEAIIMNTRGTREICQLVNDLKNVSVFVHYSTAYSQIDKNVIEEKLYRSPNNWQHMIKIAENTDDYYLQVLTQKIMNFYPNTYTLTKALAEDVIVDLCEEKIPTIIFRPTIVTPCYEDPVSGWTDNLNGPIAFLVACGKGVLRSLNIASSITNFTPVDVSTNFSLKAAWLHQFLDQDKIAVYNNAGNQNNEISVGQLIDMGKRIYPKCPSSEIIWYPDVDKTNSRIKHLFNVYVYHLLPALFVDMILRCCNKSPRLVKAQRKIFVTMECIHYFCVNQWHFKNDKLLQLDDYLNESDKKNFYFDFSTFQMEKYFEQNNEQCFRLVLKEDMSKVEQNQRRLQILKYPHYVLKCVSRVFLAYFLYTYVFIPTCYIVKNYLLSLEIQH